MLMRLYSTRGLRSHCPPAESPGDKLAKLPPISGRPIRAVVSLEEIIDAVCRHSEIPPPFISLRAPGFRGLRLVNARGMIVSLARRLTNLSYPEIAAALGWRSHTTAIAAMRRIESTMSREIDLMVQQLQPKQETA